jgi:hypothetical protein
MAALTGCSSPALLMLLLVTLHSAGVVTNIQVQTHFTDQIRTVRGGLMRLRGGAEAKHIFSETPNQQVFACSFVHLKLYEASRSKCSGRPLCPLKHYEPQQHAVLTCAHSSSSRIVHACTPRNVWDWIVFSVSWLRMAPRSRKARSKVLKLRHKRRAGTIWDSTELLG